MGFLARFTGKSNHSSSNLALGGHSIDKNSVLKPTDPTAINPTNPGNWQSIRTAPINTDPRYFTKQEADVLKALAREKTDGARQSQRAYKSLKKIEEADSLVHRHHRNYIRGVADAELGKKRADAATAKHLHRLRPEYAKLGMGLDQADNKAQQRIDQLKAKIQANY